MIGNFHAIHKHAGAVGDRTEADGNILAAPFTRNKEIGFVPEIAAVLAGFLIGKSQNEAGTGIEMGWGSPTPQPASIPLLSGSNSKRHMPSRLITRRAAEAQGYSKDLFSIALFLLVSIK